MRVREIWTFPDRGAPGVQHRSVAVTVLGLAGDRPKRAAVSVVGADAPTIRANLVLDRPTPQVELLGGSVLRIGGVLLAVDRTDNSCPGLYAAVGVEGEVDVGDVVEVLPGEGVSSRGEVAGDTEVTQ